MKVWNDFIMCEKNNQEEIKECFSLMHNTCQQNA